MFPGKLEKQLLIDDDHAVWTRHGVRVRQS